MDDDIFQNLISGGAEKSIEKIVNDTSLDTKNWTYIFTGFYDKFVKENKLLFIWLLIISIYLIYKYNSAHHNDKKKVKKHKKHKKVKIEEPKMDELESLENISLELDEPNVITNLKEEVEIDDGIRPIAEIKKNPGFNKTCNKILGINDI